MIRGFVRANGCVGVTRCPDRAALAATRRRRLMTNGVKQAWFGSVLAATLVGACLIGCRGSSARPLPEDKGDSPAARSTTPTPALEPGDAKALAEGNQAFAFALYPRLARANPKSNLAFS